MYKVTYKYQVGGEENQVGEREEGKGEGKGREEKRDGKREEEGRRVGKRGSPTNLKHAFSLLLLKTNKINTLKK